MYLLNTSNVTLKEFQGSNIPEYAILSHTWTDDEISYQDVIQATLTKAYRVALAKKKAYRKMYGFCELAKRDGFQWVWIDTCCIDKSSSSLLSESINSMYSYYKNAHTCYAYLADVHDLGPVMTADEISELRVGNALKASRWFTRGWTLQELVAPKEVEFFDSEWSLIATKTDFARTICQITGIGACILRGEKDPLSCTIAERMSWAAGRQTTREEDIAYCLLGLLDVAIPLLYGEGLRAFRRLQEAILRTSDDHTLFTWMGTASEDIPSWATTGLLAPSPSYFKPQDSFYMNLELIPYDCFDCYFPLSSESIIENHSRDQPPELTARGLRLTLPTITDPSDGMLLGFMFCKSRAGKLIFLALTPSRTSRSLYVRYLVGGTRSLSVEEVLRASNTLSTRVIYSQEHQTDPSDWRPDWRSLEVHRGPKAAFLIVGKYKIRGNTERHLFSVKFAPSKAGTAGVIDILAGDVSLLLAFGLFNNESPWCKICTMDVTICRRLPSYFMWILGMLKENRDYHYTDAFANIDSQKQAFYEMSHFNHMQMLKVGNNTVMDFSIKRRPKGWLQGSILEQIEPSEGIFLTRAEKVFTLEIELKGPDKSVTISHLKESVKSIKYLDHDSIPALLAASAESRKTGNSTRLLYAIPTPPETGSIKERTPEATDPFGLFKPRKRRPSTFAADQEEERRRKIRQRWMEQKSQTFVGLSHT
jgi:heterokaryon incompatibility protein (HET)